MFFTLFSMLGWVDDGHKRAAQTARKVFSDAYPAEHVSWTDIADETPERFVVGVHYGHGNPKKCRYYAVDRVAFQAAEITYRP
jgi:hypothetical protein